MSIKAVLFDLDDTLYGEFPHCDRQGYLAAGRYGEQVCGVPSDCFIEALQWGRKTLSKRLPDEPEIHDRTLFAQLGMERLGINPLPHAEAVFEAYWGTVLDAMVLREGVADLLTHLKAHHIPVGVCTNMLAGIQMRKLCRLGIADLCGVLVTSEEAGRDKPHASIFRLALAKLGAAPEETLMVGDSFAHDVRGARSAGLEALWLNLKHAPLPAPDMPIHQAHTFPEAAAKICRLCGLGTT